MPIEASSSPVEKKATRSRRLTSTSPMPSEAISPSSAGRSSCPGWSTGTPALRSSPAARTFWPAFCPGGTVMRPSFGTANFLDHDRIRALRHHRAGHDANAFAGFTFLAEKTFPANAEPISLRTISEARQI